MFERFTDQSRRAVVLAQEEARRLDHNHIGTEHLLAGLTREEQDAAGRALASAGVSLEAVRGQIEARSGRGQRPPSGHIPFTPRAKKCLELALRETIKLRHHSIGTGHLLLGLLTEDDCTAVQILGELGADPGQLRAQVITEIGDHPEGAGSSPPPGRERVMGPGPTLLVQGRQETQQVMALLDQIDRRLTAIERHLGIAAPDEAGEAGGPAPPGEASAAG